MSKYVKDLITDDLKQPLGRRQRRAAGQRGRAWTPTTTSAAQAASREEHPADGGQEQPGPPGHRRDRRWRPAFEGAEGTPAMCGAAKTSSPWPRKSPGWPRTSKFAPFAPKGGVMDGAQALGRRREGSQQVAQPRRSSSASWWVRSSSRARRCRPSCSARAAQLGQPDQAESSEEETTEA